MDPDCNIYKDAVEKIPEADKARLEGFLHGRAEGDAEAHAEHLASLEAEYMEKLRKLEAAESDNPA